MAVDTAYMLKTFGSPESPAFQGKYLKRHALPADIAAVWPKYGSIKVTAIYCHVGIVESLFAVFRELISTGLAKELKTYDGCHNIRKKRGLDEYSIHSWGCALDFNAALNPLGGPVRFSKAFLDVWRRHGWTCGADFKRLDGMHMQKLPRP